MRRLALTLPHHDDEVPQGFLGRVAARNGVDASSFCLHMGLDLVRVANGDGPALDLLARLTGADPAALRRNAFTRMSPHGWTVGGEVVERHMARRLDARACPACLDEDVAGWPGPPEQAAYCRTSWLVEQVRTCPTHAVALVALESDEAGRGRWATHDLAARLSAVRFGAALPVVRTYVSGLEAYLVGRLAGRRSDGWLDALPFNVVATFAERLGVAALFGPDARYGELGPDQWKAGGDAGWEVMRLGPRGFEEFASSVAGRAGRLGGAEDGLEAGFHDAFGKFWSFLLRASRRPDYHALCVAFVAGLGGPRPALPRRLVTEDGDRGRRGYRLSAASAEHRRSPARLRRLLSSRGVIGPGHERLPPRLVIVDPEAVGIAVRRLGDGLSLREAARRLGAPGRQARLLYSAGYLGEVAAERRHGMELALDRDRLDAFLRDLLARVDEIREPFPGEGTLARAARHARRPLVDVTRLVVDRRLGWVGHRPGLSGFSSVLVRLDEVRRALNGGVPPGLSRRAASRTLRVGDAGVAALVADGHLAMTSARRRWTGAPCAVVTTASLDRFQTEYASVSALAARWGIHPHAARAALAAKGVEPALPVRRYGTPIYRSTDVAHVPDVSAFAHPGRRSVAGPSFEGASRASMVEEVPRWE